MKTSQNTDRTRLLYIAPDHLKVHPGNMRRFYKPEEIAQLADSMRARMKRGLHPIIHPLRVTPNGKAGYYFGIDGSKRILAAQTIEDCPPLKCETVRENAAEQALEMIVTAQFRSSPDPISKALHFQRLLKQPHYTAQKIAAEVGCSPNTITNSLLLLELETDIRELIEQGKLSPDPRVVKALLGIPASEARVKLAQHVAREGISIKAIVTACERITVQLQEEMQREQDTETNVPPALEFAERKSHRKPGDKPLGWEDLRRAAGQMCQACEINASELQNAAEPAWELISHAADETCSRCNVRGITGACKQCPGVEILRHLLEASGVER